MKSIWLAQQDVTGRVYAVLGYLPYIEMTTAAHLTPAAPEGRNFPRQTLESSGIYNNLIESVDKCRNAGCEFLTLNGRVVDADRAPFSDLRIIIWQCDANGEYMQPVTRGDTGFRGFGEDKTDANGEFTFQTIKPTRNGDQAPIIHLKVLDGPTKLLTTQLYVSGHSANIRDKNYARLSESEKDRVSMVFEQDQVGLQTNIDVVL